MKKMWLVSGLILASIPAAFALGPLELLGNVWQKVLSIGNLNFIGVSGVAPFTRILIWILAFALFFALSSVLSLGKDKTPLFKRNQAMVVSAVLATISAIFLPVQAILAVGAGWATAVGLILIGAPVVGFAYLLWLIPGKGNETKFTVLVKLILTLILFWILSAMRNEVVMHVVKKGVSG